jgi:hypothetical protein
VRGLSQGVELGARAIDRSAVFYEAAAARRFDLPTSFLVTCPSVQIGLRKSPQMCDPLDTGLLI